MIFEERMAHMAHFYAASSKCTKKRVGIFIVDGWGDTVSYGWNHNPTGEACEIDGTTVSTVVHAEAHATNMMKGLDRDYDYGELTAYITHRPCHDCLQLLADADIDNIVVVGAEGLADFYATGFSEENFQRFRTSEALADDTYSHRNFDPIINFDDEANAILDSIINATTKLQKEAKTTDGSFMKFDSNKLRYDLIPPSATKALADILTYGAEKYAPNNWQKVDDPSRYLGALLRHIESYRAGEILDPESGRHHLAHAMTNIAFLIDLDYKPGE